MVPTEVEPVIDWKVLGLCRKPYRNHPKGCPNWNKKDICPPTAPFLHEVLDLDRPVVAIWNRFALHLHVKKMKERHPTWTIHQLRNCLYWQGTARKRLRLKVEEYLQHWPEKMALYCPEACGVDITATMKSIGVELEWPPERFTYQVALVGYPKNTGE